MGFAFPGPTELTVILHRLFPVLSPINLYYYTRIYRNSIGFYIRAHYSLIGIGYLVSLEVLSSILLFTFLAHFQIFLIVFSGSTIPYSAPYRPYVSYTQLHQEGLGAMLILVLFGIYEARGHLRGVLGKALGWSPEVDDDDEQVSYRTAVIGLSAGVVLICFWLRMTGISWWVVPIFVALMLTTFLGVTRILAETGFMTQAPLSPMQVFIHSVGTRVLGASTTVGFFLAQPWAFQDGATWANINGPSVITNVSTAMRTTHRSRVRSRSHLYVLFLALLLGSAVACVSLLYFAYSRGIYGFGGSFYVTKALNYHLNYYGGIISDPTEGHPERLLWTGAAAAVMGILILARKKFFWWPIPPVGYAVGTLLPSWWFNVLVAWLIKRNVLKFGGPSLYGQTRPFFIGLVIGQAVMVSLGALISMWTGKF